jgi:hypothetical protein
MDQDQWLFLRVTAEDGTGWRWERHDEGGAVADSSARSFADYAQALADAMNHGYLSDVKTLP